MLDKVRSGGQTGIDRIGLEEAKAAGIPTGGLAPKGFLTEDGPDLSLRDEFGLTEDTVGGYNHRTLVNVEESDGTVLFGDMTSIGSFNTIQYCDRKGPKKRPYICNPTPQQLFDWIKENEINDLNVAGNRGSKLGGIERDNARTCLKKVFTYIKTR